MRRVWPREFIKVWQSSSTTREVARELGMTASAVRQRVKRYRNIGIPLKQLDYMESWQRLIEYAKEVGPKNGK